ncbi:hypothetical protein BDV96DRAFT_602899 [Lophiotrema nucula]|uniref:Uncharacterized protein n=1 Tax=Lophiotrema nucula TaxID=690887 RepID=A0A6A5YXG6_9PLEO|nr:hypothetical protein BDV96DRAFT_602899 [Lophiotrema nucula]
MPFFRRLLVFLPFVAPALFSACAASPVGQINRPLWIRSDVGLMSPLEKRGSSDPSCPDGWLCVQGDCPAGVVCPAGETCINFEGTIGCVPAGSSWCSINPNTYQGVGCWNDSVCCDNSAVTCKIGTSCLACQSGHTCGTGSSCNGGSAPTTTAGTGPISTPNPGQVFIPSNIPSPGCVNGTGPGDYATLCKDLCSFGYCVPPCQCTQEGTVSAPQVLDPILAYPAAGRDCSFYNLCLIDCRYDPVNCPRPYCDEEEDPHNCLSVEASEGKTPAPLWTVVDCFNPGVTDPTQDQSIRWADLYTTDAWNAAVAFWKANEGSRPFPEQISNFFNLPEGALCGTVVDHNGCDTAVLCNAPNHPAGYFIFNSMVEVNNMILNLNDAVNGVGGPFALDMGVFQNTFATIEDESNVEKIILDFVSLGFSLALATQWNAILKDFPFFKQNPTATGAIQAGVGAIIQTGLTIIGQLAVKSPNPLNIQNTLDGAVANFIANQAISQVGSTLFNGSDASIAALFSLIDNGQVMEPPSLPTAVELQSYVSKAIYGFLIPQAWGLSNKPIAPFILKSGTACADGVDASVFHLTKETADATNICYENEFYFLVAAEGPIKCTTNICTHSTTCSSTFVAPDGLSTLDGTQWSGLIKDDFIIGALNSWNANNQQNGWATADPTQDKTFTDLFNLGVRTPGVVHIPVCDAETAWYNWQSNENKQSDYPCTPIPNDKKKRHAVAPQWTEELELMKREC